MPRSDGALEALAAAILDGTPIDWSAADKSLATDDLELLDQLRLLSTVATLHQPRVSDDAAADRGPGSLEPRAWGRLRLIERIGGGTFGDVYRAWDPRLHRDVALKLIRTGGADSAEETLREGRMLARIRHPAVVTIYDAALIGTEVGLCMEFVDGPTLQQRVEEHGALPLHDAIEVALQLCDALSAVHDAGLLHRDIKAANVALTVGGQVVLMDFGAGRDIEGALSGEMTGTPLYVAPEVLDGQPANVSSDIYSLGVLLHYLATGSYPVAAGSLSELRVAHRDRARSAAAGEFSSGGRVPAALRRVLVRALDPQPARRYASVAELARDLRRTQSARTAKRRLLASAAALVVVAVAVVVWLSGRSPSREPLSLAVLPFAVGGEVRDANALRQRVTRDLIAQFQAYADLRVIAATSAFSAGALERPLSEVGARLGVSTLLTGRIAQSGDALSVAAKLVRVSDERELWLREYRIAASEVMALDGQIATDVAKELRLRPGPTQTRRPPLADARALYLQGEAALGTFTADGQRSARSLFEQALALDPDYAQGYAGLARVYLRLNPQIPAVSAAEALARGSEAAARALALDASLPEAHVAAATVDSFHHDWAAAERAYRRAIELGPNNVLARRDFSLWLSHLGRFDEALEHARMAESLDPLSPHAVMGVASVFRFARRWEEALAQSEKALALDPLYPPAYLNIGHSYQGLGRLDEAIEAFQRFGKSHGNLAQAYGQAGRLREAQALVALLEERYAREGVGAGEIAQAYIGLGDLDRAFEWLDRTHEFGPPPYKVALSWDPLRSDPRYVALLKRYRLDP